MPDKAIDILDEAGSVTNMGYEIPKFILDLEKESDKLSELKVIHAKKQDFDEAAKYRDQQNEIKEKIKLEKSKWLDSLNKKHTLVTPEIISEVVSSMTGIPVFKLDRKESNKLLSLSDNLKKHVIGQDDAVDKISKGIKRARVGMKDPNKPIMASLLIGNSGVGKTELAKQLAKELFGGEDSLIRLDMSEYSSATSVSKIIGSDKGYVGYDDKTILDLVRQKPYSVVLFDEIEKAHPDVYNIFLQMFDEGHLTNSKGLRVSFKNCVILLTSNVGTKIVRDYGLGVGFQTKVIEGNSDEIIKNNLIKELEKKFSPEFLNRLNEIIYFKDLNEEDSKKIVNLELKKSIKRATDLGYKVKIDNSLVKFLCKEGFNVKYGARNLKRAIERHFEDFFTDYVIENGEPDQTVITFWYDEKDKTTKVKNKKPI
jgi:ATP-dependent Clp protease ATP-binding subunit ClpC